jgi:flagellar basal body-associated protein FliL
MTDDRRNDRRPGESPKKKNPTTSIGIFVVIVVLLVIGTLLFNAIRDKRQFDEQNAQPDAASAARTALPATGASQ